MAAPPGAASMALKTRWPNLRQVVAPAESHRGWLFATAPAERPATSTRPTRAPGDCGAVDWPARVRGNRSTARSALDIRPFPVFGWSAPDCQGGQRGTIERRIRSGPRIVIGIGPLQCAAILSLADLQGPQPVKSALRVRAQGLAARVLEREKQRGENRLSALPVPLRVRLRVNSFEQPLFINGRLALGESLPEHRAGQQIGHSRMTGDANPAFDLGAWPGKPLFLSRIKVVGRKLRVPIGAETGHRRCCHQNRQQSSSLHLDLQMIWFTVALSFLPYNVLPPIEDASLNSIAAMRTRTWRCCRWWYPLRESDPLRG